MQTTTEITPGTTVRITRITPQGHTKFIKTGTVGTTIRPDYFEFTENITSTHPGKRAYVTTDQAVTAHMKGWTQHTEVLPS
ncbi:hypothetical protein [Streptomyces sp. AS02]|uniref:hypothetical protein n=1 Tax=Streptomyces sp. AS02 TaxID=2938946 RepID=UPI00202016E7|nr:hypothetical protein [Streptomyces sp. AS02]MCL8016887.1 hypothetical protein [Streptomyces sp. AS02]